MPANILTQEDLEGFKESLLDEIKEILLKNDRITLDRWIKSNAVMNKLGISPGTLQNFRINETIPFSKLGGIIYYDEEEIHKILMDNKNFFLKDES
ncbi:helix-turn-helix domain-containing protein [Flagellimonas sp. CMM7]|uniref:helix-turn-helix domain-containing protein n=1 Tax=Flagellimonas sp. CMM7 TaxID=2654676 RepID=UPI0013D76EED|nr:helix-turn-helix domain-containing protein [Flagellimonas sp. CMM7]UII81105.1 helix-turn-helix domain-containing protein [Flagellimonas sp. CMM7]